MELNDKLHELDKRVSVMERVQMSLQQDIRNVAEHSLAVDKSLAEIKPYIEDRQRWNENKRKVLTHLMCWGAPLLAAWVLLLFSTGLRGWIRQWLGD